MKIPIEYQIGVARLLGVGHRQRRAEQSRAHRASVRAHHHDDASNVYVCQRLDEQPHIGSAAERQRAFVANLVIGPDTCAGSGGKNNGCLSG
jgi:hypothetical protein